MPQEEVRRYRDLYQLLQHIDADLNQRLLAVLQARRYMTLDYDPARLSPTELDKAIYDAEDVLAWHYRLGGEMRNLNSEYPDFSPSPTTEELSAGIMHEPDDVNLHDIPMQSKEVSPERSSKQSKIAAPRE